MVNWCQQVINTKIAIRRPKSNIDISVVSILYIYGSRVNNLFQNTRQLAS